MSAGACGNNSAVRLRETAPSTGIRAGRAQTELATTNRSRRLSRDTGKYGGPIQKPGDDNAAAIASMSTKLTVYALAIGLLSAILRLSTLGLNAEQASNNQYSTCGQEVVW